MRTLTTLLALLCMPILVLAGQAEKPADALTVLSADEDPGEMLRTYLLGEADRLLEARAKEVAALETAEAVQARIARVKKDWMHAVGPFPNRTPLAAKTVGTIQADGYRIEKVLFESRPNHHVTANLYLPIAGKPPMPGVLVPCGHSKNGKAS